MDPGTMEHRDKKVCNTREEQLASLNPVPVEDKVGDVTLMLASLFLLGTWPALLTLLEHRGRLPQHTYLDYSMTNLLATVLIAVAFGQPGESRPAMSSFFTQLSQHGIAWNLPPSPPSPCDFQLAVQNSGASSCADLRCQSLHQDNGASSSKGMSTTAKIALIGLLIAATALALSDAKATATSDADALANLEQRWALVNGKWQLLHGQWIADIARIAVAVEACHH
ncbi:hypothetical protein HU200_057194 [Digitaria exilis]|uniref:Uncharacterized protein n=1 Tax=Digitaria exilis TaxID=1010633 RepID=A0A835AQ46_9POAL|nr:hypothetical protein HU200_057194 [Digitaria exilis]